MNEKGSKRGCWTGVWKRGTTPMPPFKMRIKFAHSSILPDKLPYNIKDINNFL